MYTVNERMLETLKHKYSYTIRLRNEVGYKHCVTDRFQFFPLTSCSSSSKNLDLGDLVVS